MPAAIASFTTAGSSDVARATIATRGKRRRRSRQAFRVAARPDPNSTTTASGRADSTSVRARRSSPGVPTDCMPAVSLIMLTRPRRRTGASARRSTRVTPRVALARGADTTFSISVDQVTLDYSIGMNGAHLEHFLGIFPRPVLVVAVTGETRGSDRL